MLVDERGKGQCRVGGSPPGYFWAQSLERKGDEAGLVAVRLLCFAAKDESPSPARAARGFVWLFAARGAGLDGFGSTSILPGWVG